MPKKTNAFDLLVPPEMQGARLDRVVVDLPEVGSRRRAQQAIETGKVSIEGRPCGPKDVGRKVQAGTRVSIEWGKPGTGRAKHQARKGRDEAKIEVLHEDEWLVAVNKPTGLLTDTASRYQSINSDSMRVRLQRYLRAQGDAVYVVHRIVDQYNGTISIHSNPAQGTRIEVQFPVPDREDG